MSINHRENENPVISVSIPKDEFFKLFPRLSLGNTLYNIDRIYEEIYDDELTDICQKVWDEHQNKNMSE